MKKNELKTALSGALDQFLTQPQEGTDTQKQKRKASNALPPDEVKQRQERARRNARYISTAPAMYRAKMDTDNPRTKRVQLLFRPNVYSELLAIAHEQGRSLNNLIEEILLSYLQENPQE